MTRILKTSGFLGLAVMMLVGLHQFTILSGGNAVPAWMIGGHAHLGVLSILAIVVGFTVEAFGVAGNLRRAVTGLFVVGQWALPLTIWIGEGGGMTFLMPTSFLWAFALIAAMLIMAWQAATTDSSISSPRGATPADD